ncbi:MAG: glutamyl-tRNA amidotransferase [Bacteroidetes bacterium]|nr:MAG: glutamyl-tRNA amidotransferase [Bacteroidota bacterium]
MSLKDKIATQLKDAMRAKDKVKLESLRSIKSAILLEQSNKGAGAELNEEEEMKILIKLQKQRKDSMDIYKEQNREDLAAEEAAQLEVIETFLPKAMSEEELEAALKEIIAALGATSAQDFGKVMGKASKDLTGKADGKTISAKLKSLLS